MGRVYAYIDGFNLYYGCLKGSSDRWLDVCALLTKYVAKDDRLEHVRYFTALVKDRNGDTGPRIRQQTYLRALTTSASLSIHYGQFLESQKNARLVRPPASGSPYVRVWKTEEKESATAAVVQKRRERGTRRRVRWPIGCLIYKSLQYSIYR